MNGPNDLDDGWAELARELGLEGDRPIPAPAADHAADLHPTEDPAPVADDEEFVESPGEAPTDADVYAEAEPEAEADEGDDGVDADADDGEETESEGEPTGEPGEPKKKRRRRRRRKKKTGDAAVVPAGESEPSLESDEGFAPEESAEPLVEDTLVEEEGATPAATRELIANWDVPSWETIVNTMLFRPQGR